MAKHRALGFMESEESGIMSGLKGLWGAMSGAVKSGRSAEQAQAAHDSQRASTMADLEPAYGGGKFGSREEAKAAALKDLRANRASADDPLGGLSEQDITDLNEMDISSVNSGGGPGGTDGAGIGGGDPGTDAGDPSGGHLA